LKNSVNKKQKIVGIKHHDPIGGAYFAQDMYYLQYLFVTKKYAREVITCIGLCSNNNNHKCNNSYKEIITIMNNDKVIITTILRIN